MFQGPFGERDDQQVFIQKVIPITNKLFVRLSSTGKRLVVFFILSLTSETDTQHTTRAKM